MTRQPQSLARKFLLILVLSMSFSSILTTITFTAGAIFKVYKDTDDQLHSLASIISKNSQADLLFGDALSAETKLEALQAKSEITEAIIYDADGELFARYAPIREHRHAEQSLSIWERLVSRVLPTNLEVTRKIIQGTDVIGHVAVDADIYPIWLQLSQNLLVVALGVLASMLLTIMLGMRLSFRVLRPIKELAKVTDNVTHKKDYSIRVEKGRQDEIGQLIDSFNLMLTEIQGRDQQLQYHRDSLESEVKQRTLELSQAIEVAEAANKTKDDEISKRRAVHKKINDSIDYAGLIQKAILPIRQLDDYFGDHHSVIWYPRDVVGGDFYFFHYHKSDYLIGVIDCAGHGVPGALMTMFARAALDDAIRQHGIDSPAKLLEKMDAILRNRLLNVNMSRGLAVNMDAGLVFVDTREQRMVFAGAKMSLYYDTDKQTVAEVKGRGRVILSNKIGRYQDIPLPATEHMTVCITSDGILDQAGGSEGFGFGNRRFTETFRQNVRQKPAEQASKMMTAVNAYRGDHPQRDDITLLFFKPFLKHR